MGIHHYEGAGRIPRSRFYLIGGDERWLAREAVDALIASALGADAGPSAVTWLDGAEIGPGAVIDAVTGASLFDPRRVVVVDRAMSPLRGLDPKQRAKRAAQFAKRIGELAPRIPQDCTLILMTDKIDKRLKVVKACGEAGVVLDCCVPKGGRLIGWLQARARDVGVKITRGALEILVEYVGQDLGLLSAELEKLSLYAGGKEIRPEDVQAMSVATSVEDAFRLADAIAARDAGRGLAVVTNLLDAGEPIPRVMGLIGWQVGRMRSAGRMMDLGLAAGEIANRLRLYGPSVERVLGAARAMGAHRLGRASHLVIQADYAMKTGELPDRLALEKLVAELCTCG